MDNLTLTAKAVFDHAHEIADTDHRRAYLDEVCRGDSELRRKVEVLLRAYDQAGNFLSKPPIETLLKGTMEQRINAGATAPSRNGAGGEVAMH